MTTNTIAASADIATLLAAVDSAAPRTVQVVEPGEPFYMAPVDRTVERASELRPSVEELREELAGNRRAHYFADIYRLDGTLAPLEERGDAWWDANPTPDPRLFPNGIQNAVVRLGTEYLAVSRGSWAITGETTVAGEVAFEFTAYDKWVDDEFRATRAAEEAENRAYLDAHPEVEAAKPAWATNVEVAIDPDVSTVFYDADFGPINVSAIGKHTPATGAITVAPWTYNFSCDLEGSSFDVLATALTDATAGLEKARAAIGVTL